MKQLLRRSFILLFGGCGCELIHFTLGETGIIYFRRKGMGISRKRRSLAEGYLLVNTHNGILYIYIATGKKAVDTWLLKIKARDKFL